MRAAVLILFLCLSSLAPAQPLLPRAQPLLDDRAVPGLDDAGRAAYRRWLGSNLPRAVAIGANGPVGWAGGAGTLDQARARALDICRERGGEGCALYAENLDIVWPGRQAASPPSPGPLISSINYEFAPDQRYIWRGPAAARGVYIWSHGRGLLQDSRGLQPQPHVRLFNNAGFDVVRFDRHPNADDANRAAGWLRDGIAELRRRGYRAVVAGGQSRGGWNSLQALEELNLADVVIAVSAAAHGTGGSTNLMAQNDDLRALVSGIPASRTRVAFVQFREDTYMIDADDRTRLMERLRPRTGGLLLIDRPEGLNGHGAGGSAKFSTQFGACLLHFALDPTPPAGC